MVGFNTPATSLGLTKQCRGIYLLLEKNAYPTEENAWMIRKWIEKNPTIVGLIAGRLSFYSKPFAPLQNMNGKSILHALRCMIL